MLTETEVKLLLKLSHQIREDLIFLYNYNFFYDDFAGACAIAAWLLREKARKHGLELVLAIHGEHCWLETLDGTVVDPTYGQFVDFGEIEQDVLIGEPTEAHEPDEYRGDVHYGKAAEDLLRTWPEDQNPFSDWHQPTIQEYLNGTLLAA